MSNNGLPSSKPCSPSFCNQSGGIPFPLVIKALADSSVYAIDPGDPADANLIAMLTVAARRAGELVREAPIRRNRPNEVGNDIEPFVLRAVAESYLLPRLSDQNRCAHVRSPRDMMRHG